MKAEEKFVREYLVPKVLNALLGEDEENLEIRDTVPSKKIFIGNLYPLKIAYTQFGKEQNKIKPCTMQAIVTITDVTSPEEVTIQIFPKFNIYYRAKSDSKTTQTEDELEDVPGVIFRKYKVTDIKFDLRLADALSKEGHIDKKQIKLYLDIPPKITPRKLFAQVRVYAHKVNGEPKTYKLTSRFINASEYSRVGTVDPIFFNTIVDISLENAKVKKRELKFLSKRLLKPIYEEAGTLNCTATITNNKIRLTQIPIYQQRKRNPKPWMSPKKIAKNPLEHLKKLQDYLKKSKKIVSEDTIEKYNYFLENFKKGINLLETNEDVLNAFKLTNETFDRIWEKKGYYWHMYQIVYLVSIIPSIILGENRDVADVLNVPTGWGKTEAYLAISLFTSFYDRISESVPRVSALIKLPLRMLTLQQFGRIAEIVSYADKVKREFNVLGEPIAVGFYIGGRANRVEEARKRGQEKFIRSCPYCNGEVQYTYNEKQHRMEHHCINCKEILPVLCTDEEIYRYLPSIVVSTLDKLPATAPVQRNVRAIWGAPLLKCPDHGYTPADRYPRNRCIVRSCGSDLIPVEKRLGPVLLVQDELHMVREEIGTLDSHYETFFMETQKRYTGQTPKVIGSTATISGVEHQIKNLYCLKAEIFPPKGSESVFYEETDDIQREIIGIMPHGRVTKFATYRVIEFIIKALRYARDNANSVSRKLGISPEELIVILKNKYWQVVAYSLTRRGAYGLIEGIQNELIENVFRNEQFRYEHITGEDSLEVLARKMDSIQSQDERKKAQVIVVTKIMSHGIHFPPLNLIVFQGMPRNISELLQMMSRIGREFTGSVFIIFYPTRERDISYYNHFKTFFGCIDEMIEEIPIHRYSRGAIDMTINPIVMAGLISLLSSKAQDDYYFREALVRHLNQGKFPSKLFEKYMKEAYVADGDETEYYARELPNFLRNLQNLILMRRDRYTVDAIGRGERVNQGLRSTTEQVEIIPRTEFIEALAMLPKPMFTGRDEEVEESED